MKDKIVLITGATSGVGKETARELLKQGAQVVMLVRNTRKAEQVRDQFLKDNASAKVSIIECDLASLQSVRNAAGQIKKDFSKIDILINNAGAIYSRRLESKDGYELSFAMNHLGHYLLTTEILDIITATKDSRIINVSSEAHRMGKLDFDDLMADKKYRAFKVYGDAKLANIYFTYELARRLEGTGTTVNALHPGVVRTHFGNDFTGLWRLGFLMYKPFSLSPVKGAITSIYLASSDDVKTITGKYFKKKKAIRSSGISYDKDIAERLWSVSEKLVNQA